MTVAAQNVAPQIVAAAGQTVFPFAWRCDNSSLIAVYVNDVPVGGFGVALNGDQFASPGGSVVLPASLGGEVVTIERVSAQTQTTAFTKYGPFPASTITNFFDAAVMLLQELAASISKGLRAARSNLALFSSLELPAPQDGAALVFQADPLAAGKFKFSKLLAATKDYLENYVQQFIANGGVVQPVSWVIIGDDVNTDYAIAGAVLNSPDLYEVAIDGAFQEPVAAYTVDTTVTPAMIRFTSIVPLNTRAYVRSIGYSKAVSSDTISGNLGDANVVLVSTSPRVNRFATALTANRTVTLPAAGLAAGARFRIVRTGLGNFTLNVGGGLKIMPALTAAFVEVMYDGAAWQLIGYGTL